jgi:hypothetical protein
VPALPPELARPFEGEEERDAAGRLLARRDRVLRAVEELVGKPAGAWSPAELGAFPPTTNGVPDPPPQRVARWAGIFADELAEVHRLVARRPPLSDVELREALYLTGRLLATVTGLGIDEVDAFALR